MADDTTSTTDVATTDVTVVPTAGTCTPNTTTYLNGTLSVANTLDTNPGPLLWEFIPCSDPWPPPPNNMGSCPQSYGGAAISSLYDTGVLCSLAFTSGTPSSNGFTTTTPGGTTTASFSAGMINPLPQTTKSTCFRARVTEQSAPNRSAITECCTLTIVNNNVEPLTSVVWRTIGVPSSGVLGWGSQVPGITVSSYLPCSGTTETGDGGGSGFGGWRKRVNYWSMDQTIRNDIPSDTRDIMQLPCGNDLACRVVGRMAYKEPLNLTDWPGIQWVQQDATSQATLGIPGQIYRASSNYETIYGNMLVPKIRVNGGPLIDGVIDPSKLGTNNYRKFAEINGRVYGHAGYRPTWASLDYNFGSWSDIRISLYALPKGISFYLDFISFQNVRAGEGNQCHGTCCRGQYCSMNMSENLWHRNTLEYNAYNFTVDVLDTVPMVVQNSLGQNTSVEVPFVPVMPTYSTGNWNQFPLYRYVNPGSFAIYKAADGAVAALRPPNEGGGWRGTEFRIYSMLPGV
jgi:hypothetical protein